MKNHKYIVFKVGDIAWRDAPSGAGEPDFPRFATVTEDQVIEDATVIRHQDAFAPPALWAYANTIGLVAQELLNAGVKDGEDTLHQLRMKGNRLQRIADYFSEAAEEAAHTIGKLPD